VPDPLKGKTTEWKTQVLRPNQRRTLAAAEIVFLGLRFEVVPATPALIHKQADEKPRKAREAAPHPISLKASSSGPGEMIRTNESSPSSK
jgi:hypothetical protein